MVSCDLQHCKYILSFSSYLGKVLIEFLIRVSRSFMVSVYRLANCLGVISRGHCLRRLERILGFPFPTASAVDWARSWAAEPRLDGAMEMSSRQVPRRLRHLAQCIGSVVPSSPRKTKDLRRRRKRSHRSRLDERFAFLMSCQPEHHHVGEFPAREAHILF